MKNFVSILFAVILILSFAFSVSAKGNVSFSAENTTTKNNRIFSISVRGNGDEILSAVKFVFEYDGNAIEYRKINPTDQNTIIKEAEEKGRLTLILLNEQGIDLSNSPQLFTVNFKAENLSKNQEITFTVSDCVNSKVESFNATGGKCLVTYLGNAKDDEDSNGNSSGRTDKTNENDNLNSKDEDFDNYGEQENINQQNNEESNTLNVREKDNTLQIFISGAVFVIVLGIIGGILYHLGRRSAKKDNSKQDEYFDE